MLLSLLGTGKPTPKYLFPKGALHSSVSSDRPTTFCMPPCCTIRLVNSCFPRWRSGRQRGDTPPSLIPCLLRIVQTVRTSLGRSSRCHLCLGMFQMGRMQIHLSIFHYKPDGWLVMLAWFTLPSRYLLLRHTCQEYQSICITHPTPNPCAHRIALSQL